jgi:drug/metabolite transporter (DMT)-like permease
VAASVLLVNAAPLFTVVLARVFLGEQPTARVLIAIALALAGALLIAIGDWSSAGPAPLLGDALALAGAVTLAVYHVAGRGLRAALPLGVYLIWVWGFAAALLGLAALAAGVPLLGHPPRAWAAFLALALVPTLAGHGLVNVSLRLLPAPTVGLFLLGEPVGATLLALALFGETPGAWTLAGGAVILAALALVVSGSRA